MVRELQWLLEPRTADHLPDVVWQRILSLLPERDQAQARKVCRRLHRNATKLREQDEAVAAILSPRGQQTPRRALALAALQVPGDASGKTDGDAGKNRSASAETSAAAQLPTASQASSSPRRGGAVSRSAKDTPTGGMFKNFTLRAKPKKKDAK